MILFKIIYILILLKCANNARILGVFPLDWGSHYILGTKLMNGLAETGHDITFVSPRKYNNPPKNGSWTDIVLKGIGDDFQKLANNLNFLDESNKNVHNKALTYINVLLSITNQTLRHPNVQKLFNSDLTFDAVIVDQIMNDCHHVFAYHFKCPLILLNSNAPNQILNTKVGNSAPVATVMNLNENNTPQEITLITRFWNLYRNIGTYLMNLFYILPQNNKILHEVYPHAPDIYDIYYNVSLVLLNSHPSLCDAIPLVPNMVEIGGYHIDRPQKLSQDLQEFIDGAKDGVIYFSMGSHVKSKDMLAEKKKTLLGVFKKLKQKILWKFEEDLPEKSDNILIRNWLPQNDILAHPNTKLFITHGGLLSTTETIYNGVPVLALPIFGDQETNADAAVKNGYGLKISYHDINFSNEQKLYNVIQELLNNDTYSDIARSKSKIYHDRPLTPLQSAVYWVEYVIRHKGAPHLRVAGVGMPWYKYFMIDVIAASIFIVVLVVLDLKYIFKSIFNKFTSKGMKSDKVKRN